MKISTILSGVLLFASTCYAVPKAVPVPESDFDIQVFSEDIFSPETADMINELISTYGLNKRDQATIASILQTVNDSGIIFEILDSVASSPKQIQGLANYTSLLVGQLNISLLLGMLTSSSSSSSSSVNTSGILSAVSNSGLIQSILLGTLLDTSFQPVLAHITERVIRANEDVLLYAVTAYLQPASSNSKRATSSSSSTAGSLSSFVGNLAGSLLNSQIFASSLTDTLGALNDTGIALYIVKRFLSNDLYINMTGTLITDVLAASGAGSSDITSLISTLNITSLIDSSLSNPDYIVSLVTNILSGNLSSYTSGLGQYSGALTNIVDIMQNDGLFVELNSLIFPSSTTVATGQGKDAKTTISTSTTTGATVVKSSTSSKAEGSALIPSSLFTIILGTLLLL